MNWHQQIAHRLRHPLYRKEVILLGVMLFHVLLAAFLVFIHPSFVTGAFLGMGIGLFVSSAYSTLFN